MFLPFRSPLRRFVMHRLLIPLFAGTFLLTALVFAAVRPVYAASLNLKLTHAAANYNVQPGEDVAFTLTLTNSGSAPSGDVVVANKLPRGLTYRSAAGDGTYDAIAGTWTLAPADLAPGSPATMVIHATPTLGGVYANVAQVWSVNGADSVANATPGNDNPLDRDDYATATIAAGDSTGFCFLLADGGTNANRRLYSFDAILGSQKLIGSLNVPSSEANAYNPFTGVLYGSHEGGTPDTFGTIDLTSGAFNPILTTFARDYDGMEYDLTTGLIWAIGTSNDDIYIINPANGASTFVAATSGMDIDAMGIDPATGLMYVINATPNPDTIVVLNKYTGAVIETLSPGPAGATTPFAPGDFNDLEGLSFGLDGVMRGTSGNANGTPRAYFEFDKVTGLPTAQTNLPMGDDFESISCLVAATDLEASKDDGQATFSAGERITYNLTITNSAIITASGVIVTDTLPTDHVTFVDATDPFSFSGGQVTWSGLTLSPGASRNFTVTIDLDPSLPANFDLLVNAVDVGDDGRYGPDPTPYNNHATDVDVPLATVGAIGDTIWLDEDGNGFFDAGETGLANVVVSLFDGTSTITTTTDLNGRYLFPACRRETTRSP